MPAMHPKALSEQNIVALLAAVAFVVALSATLMFPLGPFVVADIGGSPDSLGHLGAVYSLAAGCGGLAASFVLDRFDRRDALGVFVAAFTLATAVSAAAADITSLMLMRALAGLCAGPIWGLLVAIAADVVPLQRRGRAMSRMVGSYGLALVLGLPAGALLGAMPGGWRWAMLGLALGGGAISAATARAIGPCRAHLDDVLVFAPRTDLANVLKLMVGQPSLIAFLMIGSTSFAALLISPNLPVFVLRNTELGVYGLVAAYLIGGALTLAAMPLTGWMTDGLGALPVGVVAAAVTTIVLSAAFFAEAPLLPTPPLLAIVLVMQLVRSAVTQGSATRVPPPAQRAAFQALAAAVTNFAQALGAGTAPFLLSIGPDGRLAGMDRVACLVIASSWATPLLLMRLDAVLRRRQMEHREMEP